MQKLNLDLFVEKKVECIETIKGGGDTDGGDYFFGRGTSTCDYEQPDGSGCLYYFEGFEDSLDADCQE